ncbi:hypothetical protein AMTR_s00080p00175080 [Amborella trichopoda]|uniref:Uncharacterized protein n=1 Tax=Amborella trichopoda TaxID=13333 RepID=W1PB94_AMBTC|nr:hypothetical protein AMTR_s00080p00175080 [Amborella trichopoda]
MIVRGGEGAWLREAEVVEDRGGDSREQRGDTVRAAAGCSQLEVKRGGNGGLRMRVREGSGYGCLYLVKEGGWKREEKNGNWVVCCNYSGLKRVV